MNTAIFQRAKHIFNSIKVGLVIVKPLSQINSLIISSYLIVNIQGDSLARGPKLLSMYKVEQRGFLFRKYWHAGSFKACQTEFRTEFGERSAPSKSCS